MQTKLIDDRTVQAALDIPELIPLMGQVFRDLAAGSLKMLPRTALFHPNRNIFALMPASIPSLDVCGCKTAIFPGPATAAAGTQQSVVLLFSIETGALLGVVSAEHITVARTAASSGAATDLLALPDAEVLCLIGAGNQAMGHAKAMCAVRPIRQIRVTDTNAAFLETACERLRAQHPGVEVIAMSSAEEAVRGAQIICTVTKASEPVLYGDWLTPGAHINAVGACGANVRELDDSVLARSRVFIDQMETAMVSAGDLLIPMQAGKFRKEDIAGEIGAVGNGDCVGRAAGDRETITVFETCGLAAQDIAAAYAVWKKDAGEHTFAF